MATTFANYFQAPKVNRLPKNPLDKCTIVSVYPEPITDYKPTAFPSTHIIEGAPVDDFSILVVGSASWFKEMEEGQPFLEINISSIQVAEAFIKDYVIGLQGYQPGVAHPGLFFVPGAYTKETIKKYVDPNGMTFDKLLAQAKERQKKWWAELVRQADILWSRTSGNPLAISKDARVGAEVLGLKDKPWMGDIMTMQKENCKACGYQVNPQFPVCPNCKAIVNESKAKELNIKFAS